MVACHVMLYCHCTEKGIEMKIVTALVLLMAFATIAFAADPPKEADTVDYSMDAPSRIVIDGELTESSPT